MRTYVEDAPLNALAAIIRLFVSLAFKTIIFSIAHVLRIALQSTIRLIFNKPAKAAYLPVLAAFRRHIAQPA